MPPSEPSRVFISYARKDGAALAQRLQSDLTKQGFDAWLDTQRIDGGRVWSTKIEGAIKSCSVMIALMSPGSYASEICRSEQLLALDQGNRVIPVVAVKGADRPLYLYARQYRDFTNTNDANYLERLSELLADIRGDATAALPDSYRETRVTYLTAPPRVANYLERPEALHALRDALFAEDHRQPIALTALAGMGGVGKTVLAKALTEDEVVQRAFPDGIVWITAGKERKRDFIEEMREVAKALGDDLSGYDTALACENQYRTTIASKAALIVVDDVWSKSDIEPLLAESPRSRFLFTTRDAAIGRFVAAREHRADLLDMAQSRELLASWAKVPVAELPAVADEMIAECGRLPLALSVVGATLRGTAAEFWTDTLELLRKADLAAIEDQLPEGQQSFFKAVEVSFQSLKPEMQDRYKALAILLEDMAAPLPILQTLWNLSEAEARRTSRHLVDRSLAQQHLEPEGIHLHDLQLDYVRTEYHKTLLDNIHGAMVLSFEVITEDPSQFASQMLGRLLPSRPQPARKRFLRFLRFSLRAPKGQRRGVRTIYDFFDNIVEGTQNVWLRPMRASLVPAWYALLPERGPFLHNLYKVNALAVTPDGRRAVSAGSMLQVWDLKNGRSLRTLIPVPSTIGGGTFVHAVALTPDGRRVISACSSTRSGETLKVWNARTGRELRTLTGHAGGVTAVAVTPDGRRAVSASSDGALKVWELSSGRELHTLVGHAGGVTAVAVMPDGQRAVSASSDGALKVWELSSGRELHTLVGHAGGVTAVAVMPDGQRAVSASSDGALKVWDLASGRELRTLTGHTMGVTAVAVTRDRQRAVSASYDRTLKVWDLASGGTIATFTCDGSPTACAFANERKVIVAGDNEGYFHILRLEEPNPRH